MVSKTAYAQMVIDAANYLHVPPKPMADYLLATGKTPSDIVYDVVTGNIETAKIDFWTWFNKEEANND